MRPLRGFLIILSLLTLAACDTGPGPNESPTASFSFSPQDPAPGEAVDFTASASDPDGQIDSYSWDFDDGDTGSGPNPTHAFETQGSYNVTLTVTDDRGGTATASRTVDVENVSPTVNFSFSPENPRAGTAVDFTADASDPDGQIETYSWDFGDGETANGPNPTHTFENQGSYDVTLTVTDNKGGTASANKTVDVRQRYTRATVTEVEIQDMPFTNEEGQGWDSSTGPDVYYQARDPNDDQLERSSTINNVGPADLPITPAGEFTVEELTKEHDILLWDEDGFTSDEFIGGIAFTLESEIGDYPDTLTLDVQGITLDLTLDWKK